MTLIRDHWQIENGLHYRRDVSLGEDHSLLRTGHGPAVLAGLNNLIIGLYARWQTQNMADGQRELLFGLERSLIRQTTRFR